MFYECKKCKRRWEYPLANCPYCLVPLEKMESKTARVKSVVKVAIPTLFHPSAPYYVLLLEDENGNQWGYKSEKEYQEGDELKFEPNADAVGIWRVKYDFQEGIEKALELVGGIDVDGNSKIVILPTVAKPSHSYFRDNTSPEFLAATIQLLLDRGAQTQNITVAAQSFDEMPLTSFGTSASGASPVAAAAQKAGLIAAGAKFNVLPLDLATSEFEKVDKFEIAKPVLAADLVINLAMEKIGQASATANLFKVLKKENYLGQKYLSSEAEIATGLELLLKNMICVGEAEYVQRSNKLTAFLGLVLAARSARNLDRVFNEVTQAFKMPEIVKEIDIASVPLAGRTIKEVQYQAEIF